MKYLSIAFLAGLLVGALIIFVLYNQNETPLLPNQSDQLLDEILSEWTTIPDTSQSTTAFFFHINGARIGTVPDTVRALARRVQSLYHVPEGVVVAQWILESKWGLADLGANNYFGHTYAATKRFYSPSHFVLKQDKQYVNGIVKLVHVRFARYTDIAQCFDVHGKYLSTSVYYRDAFKKTSPEKFARSLAKHYAADPDYALKLITIMRRYKL
jgi:flagellar protein FlgJ